MITSTDPRMRAALAGFGDEEIPDRLPTRLPLLEAFSEAHAHTDNPATRLGDLNGVRVLFIQHHLAAFLPRIQTMVDEGMAWDQTWMVDIPYSTNEQVRDIIAGKAGVHMAKRLHDPLAPYHRSQLGRVMEAVEEISDSLGSGSLLVVDDGAYFIRALHQLRDRPGLVDRFRGRTHIVEQTTRGHRYLTNREHKEFRNLLATIEATVVSIARCATKTQVEAPFIGAAASRGLRQALVKLGANPARLERVAIIGYGTVGQWVFDALKTLAPNARLTVVDTSWRKRRRIKAFGGSPHRRLPRDQAYDMVVGCTGYASFDLDDRRALATESLLVSCSSAAVEFNRSRFIEKAEADGAYEILSPASGSDDIRAPIVMTDGDRRFIFVNAGFPVNFDGELDNLPLRFIQATHTLLYAAGWQALRSTTLGVRALDPRADRWILNNALHQLEPTTTQSPSD